MALSTVQPDRSKNAFAGKSLLREQEKVVQGPSEQQKELQKYLASKYASGEPLAGSEAANAVSRPPDCAVLQALRSGRRKRRRLSSREP